MKSTTSSEHMWWSYLWVWNSCCVDINSAGWLGHFWAALGWRYIHDVRAWNWSLRRTCWREAGWWVPHPRQNDSAPQGTWVESLSPVWTMPHLGALRQLSLPISSDTYTFRKDDPLRFFRAFSWVLNMLHNGENLGLSRFTRASLGWIPTFSGSR